MTFKTYLTHLCIAEAKRLLLATDNTVEEIIAAADYTNVNKLYQIFRRYMALRPGEYREQYRLVHSGDLEQQKLTSV